MINSLVLMGRVVNIPKLETKDGKTSAIITLKVPRNYRNIDGKYDDDYIDVKVVSQCAISTCNYCSQGDMIAIKGMLTRLQNDNMEVLAEKVTFLASKGKEEE